MGDVFAHIDAYDRAHGAKEHLVLGKPYRVCSVFRHEAAYQVLLVEDASGCLFVLKIAEDYRREVLRAEYALFKKLEHEGIPKAVCCVEQNTLTLFLREYVQGRTLADYAEEQSFTTNTIVHWAQKACRIVSYLHQQQPSIIHRDIKPENFIVSPTGELMLIDLGAAQIHDPNKSTDTVLLGTLATAAPEQFGARRSDTRSDVYGIGMLLVYLLTNDTNLRVLSACSAPRWLKRVIHRSTSFDPDKRYPTISALESKLQKGLRYTCKWHAALCATILLSCTAIWVKGTIDHQKVMQAAENAKKVVLFAEPLIERAIADRLGIPPGTITTADLERVRSLFLGGNTPFVHWGEVECSGRGGTFINIQQTGVRSLSHGNIGSLEDLLKLPNLQRLALYSQNITDISALKGMPLTHLALGDNEIEDFSALASLGQLVCLDVAGTGFKDASLLSGCAFLEALNICDTQLWDLSPLIGLPIHELRLDYASISDNATVLEAFSSLKLLKLRHASEKTLGSIGQLVQLEFLDLSEFTSSTLEPLHDLTRLRSLFVSGGQLRSLVGVEDMTSLQTLVIANNAVSDLSPLFALPRLRELAIGNTAIADYTQLRSIPSLRIVGVSTAQERALLQEMECPFQIRLEDW